MTFEVHIASPKESIFHSRVLVRAIIDWLFSMGVEKILTCCPEGKIANLARKTGLKEVDKQMYEAAEVDGASYPRVIWSIALPSIKNQIFIILNHFLSV